LSNHPNDTQKAIGGNHAIVPHLGGKRSEVAKKKKMSGFEV
jgi:hypothetical protein